MSEVDFSGSKRIAGQAPRLKWKRNRGRKKRTLEEALALAEANGIEIPHDVEFIEAEKGDLKGSLADLLRGGEMQTARGPWIEEHADGYVYWKDHYNKSGRIPFRVHADIFTSDEGIIAVFTHEVFELEQFRAVFMASKMKRMNAADYGIQCSPGYPGNFHDLAWDAADEAVRRMREKNK